MIGSVLGTENMEVKRQHSSYLLGFPSKESMDPRGVSFEDWEIPGCVQVGLG